MKNYWINDEDSPQEYERKERKKSKYEKNAAQKNIIQETKDEKEKKMKDEKDKKIKDEKNKIKKENIITKRDYKLNYVIKETQLNNNKTKAMESQDIEQKFEKI